MAHFSFIWREQKESTINRPSSCPFPCQEQIPALAAFWNHLGDQTNTYARKPPPEINGL